MNTSTDNPLLKERKEFLQRQSQEYKNALMGEVHELKEKSQDIGKKALVAGGAILLSYALAKALMGSGKGSEPQKLLEYKGKKKKNKHRDEQFSAYEDLTANASAFDVTDVPYTETFNDTDELPPQPAVPDVQPAAKQHSVTKDILGVVAQQITAYLIILGTRKLEEYLNARNHTSDAHSASTAGNTAQQQYGDTYTSAGAADIQSAVAE